ncbi:type III-B CRISPR module RAMP protein Cmr4 [Oculatella sp. FACHB-28]|uniref:type III-B CRISPR module RAMP protein Cmr4 n=1 Tax=Oculatella sp. FACHB-28 TaxID=2692845 RepID=UPI0016833168|nr:type III-B CRISPR module RAMP protein Cmr4 [Oculatella sp. FACHB-28]MBD2054631.1 type III-B CRISPR module RAMP protein Cmr4 [Oculatella sp. FACHB-28]
MNLVYFYLLSPLHTGGATQEGNLLGIARESHTELPYVPSSSIRGRLRASVEDQTLQYSLFGNEISAEGNLVQGTVWIGDGSLLWIPVPSLSHGVIWVSSPMLLRRWARVNGVESEIPTDYSTNLNGQKPVYLKDAILKASELKGWDTWKNFVPQADQAQGIERVLVLPDKHCATLIQMSLWRQVKVKLDEHKTVKDGSFRYEEAIPPDTLMYFPWGTTAQANGTSAAAKVDFQELVTQRPILQIGGQESLGRGFVQTWLGNN